MNFRSQTFKGVQPGRYENPCPKKDHKLSLPLSFEQSEGQAWANFEKSIREL